MEQKKNGNSFSLLFRDIYCENEIAYEVKSFCTASDV